MTDTLEPPVQQTQSAPALDPQKVAAPSAPSSFQERMRQTRELAAKEVAGGEGASPTEKAVVEAREKRREQQKPKDEKVVQKPVEGKETPSAEAKNPFDVLNDLQTKGVDENEAKTEDKTPPPPAGSTEKAISTWKEMNAALDQAKKDLAEARAIGTADDIKNAKAEVESAKSDMESLKKERDQLRNELAAKDVTKSTQYIETVTNPCNEIIKELDVMAKAHGIPWKNVQDLLILTDPEQRDEMLETLLTSGEKEFGKVSATKFVSAACEYFQRDDIGRNLEAKAGEVAESLKQKEAQHAKDTAAQTEAQFNKTKSIVFEKMKEAIPQLKDDPEFAKKVLEAAKMADDPPHIRAMKDIWMASAERVLKDHQAKHQEDTAMIKSLEERVAKLTGATPSVEQTEVEGGGSGSLDDKRPIGVRMAELRKSQGH